MQNHIGLINFHIFLEKIHEEGSMLYLQKMFATKKIFKQER